MVPWRKGNSVVFQKHSDDGTRIATRFVNDKSAHAVAKAPNPAQGVRCDPVPFICARSPVRWPRRRSGLRQSMRRRSSRRLSSIRWPRSVLSTTFRTVATTKAVSVRPAKCSTRLGIHLAVGNLTDTLTYTFTLTPAEIADIAANPAGNGTLSMTAARDLGLRAGT